MKNIAAVIFVIIFCSGASTTSADGLLNKDSEYCRGILEHTRFIGESLGYHAHHLGVFQEIRSKSEFNSAEYQSAHNKIIFHKKNIERLRPISAEWAVIYPAYCKR
jgi:hypothetical protein